VPLTFIRNKIDLTGAAPGRRETPAGVEIALAARTGAGLDALRAHLKGLAGLQDAGEGAFIARRRHLDTLNRARVDLVRAGDTLEQTGAAELAAEDLRRAQEALGEITGAFTSDDLLGRIFSSFCIGK
jgi:tRNA modification GTPase